MGLFDKLKKAFSSHPENQEAEEPRVEEPRVEEPKTEEPKTEESKTEKPEPEVIEEPKPLDEKAIEVTTEQEPVIPTEKPDTTATPEEKPGVAVEEDSQDINEVYDTGLTKTRKTFGDRLNALFANFRSVDEAFFDELEEMLIGADVGFDTAIQISESLREEVKLKNVKSKKDVSRVIIEKMVDLYGEAGEGEDNSLHYAQPEGELTVFLFVGVNGVGKTTTIGKLAHQLHLEGKKVLLVAGDTFRAGAIEQLVEWGNRVDVPVVRGKAEGDPAAVVFDGVKKAKEEHFDILLVDTAGRLQNKVNLMNELEKMKRIITREVPNAPQEVLLVLDATTGQNALVQAKQFKETTQVTGIVLTKLDGSAKGGIVIAIRQEMHLPVKLVGLGEKMDDLRPFDPNAFIIGLFKGLVDVDD